MIAPIIHDNGKTNPLIEVPRAMVIDWLRSIADQAGYADRENIAVQLVIELRPVFERPPEDTEVLVLPRSPDRKSAFWLDAPSLILMVSNIPNSREAPPVKPDAPTALVAKWREKAEWFDRGISNNIQQGGDGEGCRRWRDHYREIALQLEAAIGEADGPAKG